MQISKTEPFGESIKLSCIHNVLFHATLFEGQFHNYNNAIVHRYIIVVLVFLRTILWIHSRDTARFSLFASAGSSGSVIQNRKSPTGLLIM